MEVCVDKSILCDSVGDEILITSTESGRKSLITAAAKRRDDDLFSYSNEFCNETASELPVFRYHRLCYKIYTSKQNLKSVSAKKESPDIDSDLSNCLVPEKMITIHKSVLFAHKKSHKRVKTLHTISSAERLVNLIDAAFRACDGEMINRIEQDNLLNNAVYHAACLTTY